MATAAKRKAKPKSTAVDLSYIAEGLRSLAVPVDSLDLHPTNPRKHSPEHLEEIAASLKVNGQVKNIVASTRTEPPTVVCGNGTLQAARSLGWSHIATEMKAFTEAQENQLAIIDNVTGAKPEWDAEALAELLKDVDTNSDPRLDEMLSELAESEGLIPHTDATEGPEAQIDRADELQKKWQTAQGQLWEVPSKTVPGKCHRILCGDSTKAEDVERVMGGETLFIMVTDPPYGVEYDPEWRQDAADAGHLAYGAARFGKVASDDRVDWTDAYRLFSGSVAYVWHAGRYAADLVVNLRDADFEIRSQIIWRKPAFAISRGHYHWQHEPCWYAVRKGSTARWCGDRSQSTVWDISNRQADHSDHGTQKPVEVMARPIRNHGDKGDVVYDPFLGSGTTTIAAEQTGRTCIGCEIEPKYVAVILERLEQLELTPHLVEENPEAK